MLQTDLFGFSGPVRKSDVMGGIKINRARRVSVTFRKVILNHSAL